ncbi:MAG: hypothetical protein JSS81_04665 [Acidobacteria bacterium]|nr:hypothetical protein [Acidobacteriota bacterium]
MKRRSGGILAAAVAVLAVAQFVRAQDQAAAVAALVKATLNAHPSVTERSMAARPVAPNKNEAAEKTGYANSLAAAIDGDDRLQPPQKAFAKANADRLVERMSREALRIRERNTDPDRLLRDSLRARYAGFSLRELNDLSKYFETEDGHNTLRYLAKIPLRRKGEISDSASDEMTAYDRFIRTPLGTKFFDIFITAVEKDLAARTTAGKAKMKDELARLGGSGATRIVDEFVAENFGRPDGDKSAPAGRIAEFLAAARNEKRKKAEAEQFEKRPDYLNRNDADLFDAALKENTVLSSDEKAFARANYDRLSRVLAAKTTEIRDRLAPQSEWDAEFFKTALPRAFTFAELENVDTFLRSAAGREALNRLLSFEAGEESAFFDTYAGGRLLNIVDRELPDFIGQKRKEINLQIMGEIFKLVEPPALNKLINEFVRENYKK